MFLKGTKIYSIITGYCPKCQEESMYQNKNPYALQDTLRIHDRCSNCNTQYRLEPSFFYGAMYVSYPVGIVFAVIAYFVAHNVFNASLNMTFLSIVVTMIVFLPIILRVSRNIWINLFVKYDKSLAKKKTN